MLYRATAAEAVRRHQKFNETKLNYVVFDGNQRAGLLKRHKSWHRHCQELNKGLKLIQARSRAQR